MVPSKGTIPEEGFEWKFIDATPPDVANRDPPCVYIPFGHSKTVLPKGWQKTPVNKQLDIDIIFEKDVAVTLRDDVKVRFFLDVVNVRFTLISTGLKTPTRRSQQLFPTLHTERVALAQTSWTWFLTEWVCPSHAKVVLRSSKGPTQTNGVCAAMQSSIQTPVVHLIPRVIYIIMAKKTV